jgi:hypothetical protein
MNIAIIGWGSLIWCPRRLQIEQGWHRDGPMLPIEFARESSDGRLTLVIHPRRKKQRTYWATSTFKGLSQAIENLREREGKNCREKDIHFLGKGLSDGRGDARSMRAVGEWLRKRENPDAAIWTGLPGTYDRDSAIRYLKGIKDPGRLAEARKYVRMTPPQIQTVVRAAMRKEGWSDCDLPAELFARDT